MTVDEADERHQAQDSQVRAYFEEHLNIDSEVAEILVQEGFVTLEEVAYVPIHEMLEIDGFDEDMVNKLRNRARDAILALAIVSEEQLEKIDEDLKTVAGIDQDMLRDLAQQGITSRDDLAELSVDELIEITGVSNETAKTIIMDARSHWFTEEGGANE